jgi:DnaJ-class molecular chaperone
VIKKTYKKLSLLYHPDKADDPPDPAVQSRYISLVKAYETLTGILEEVE